MTKLWTILQQRYELPKLVLVGCEGLLLGLSLQVRTRARLRHWRPKYRPWVEMLSDQSHCTDSVDAAGCRTSQRIPIPNFSGETLTTFWELVNAMGSTDPRQPDKARQYVPSVIAAQDLPPDYSSLLAIVCGIAGVMLRVSAFTNILVFSLSLLPPRTKSYIVDLLQVMPTPQRLWRQLMHDDFRSVVTGTRFPIRSDVVGLWLYLFKKGNGNLVLCCHTYVDHGILKDAISTYIWTRFSFNLVIESLFLIAFFFGRNCTKVLEAWAYFCSKIGEDRSLLYAA
jgi:hypothetical protein